MSDAFESASVDTDRWQVAMPQYITEADGKLSIALPAGQNVNALIASTTRIDLTGRAVTATVSRSVSQSTTTQDQLVVLLDDDNELAIVAANGQILFRHIVAGTTSDAATAIAFDASIDRWQISHDATTGMIVYATAVGEALTRRAMFAPPFAIEAMRIQLEADEYNGGAADPGVAQFDAIAVSPEQCTSDHSHAPPI